MRHLAQRLFLTLRYISVFLYFWIDGSGARAYIGSSGGRSTGPRLGPIRGGDKTMAYRIIEAQTGFTLADEGGNRRYYICHTQYHGLGI